MNSPQKSELKLGEGEEGQEAAKVSGVLWWWSAGFRRGRTANRQTGRLQRKVEALKGMKSNGVLG